MKRIRTLGETFRKVRRYGRILWIIASRPSLDKAMIVARGRRSSSAPAAFSVSPSRSPKRTRSGVIAPSCASMSMRSGSCATTSNIARLGSNVVMISRMTGGSVTTAVRIEAKAFCQLLERSVMLGQRRFQHYPSLEGEGIDLGLRTDGSILRWSARSPCSLRPTKRKGSSGRAFEQPLGRVGGHSAWLKDCERATWW
jgi:hypothetical protein